MYKKSAKNVRNFFSHSDSYFVNEEISRIGRFKITFGISDLSALFPAEFFRS